jgi:phosphopantetheinyl transferase
MEFLLNEPRFLPPAVDLASSLEGIVETVPADRVYKKAVLFGPCYHNLKGEAYLSPAGALGHVSGSSAESAGLPLGSPFPLDAAFHLASLWGQRYYNMQSIPVALQQRLVVSPTEKDGTYSARVVFKEKNEESLVFDIWLHDTAGQLHEAVLGLVMRGTRKDRPVSRIKRGKDPEGLSRVSEHSSFYAVFDHRALDDFAEKSLTPGELSRFEGMGDRRRQTFLGARLALKMVWRKISGDLLRPAESIHTVHEDNIRPAIPQVNGEAKYNCSVSHDSRFSVAAASRKRIGIDVEEITDRVLKVKKYYTRDSEAAAVAGSELEKREAYTRIWTIKEAVSKALNISLPDSWELVSVETIGHEASDFLIEDNAYHAHHDTIDSHIFTIVIMD